MKKAVYEKIKNEIKTLIVKDNLIYLYDKLSLENNLKLKQNKQLK